eukprot:scaffold83988_cov28-Tisochrysis_lutea.AAC.1
MTSIGGCLQEIKLHGGYARGPFLIGRVATRHYHHTSLPMLERPQASKPTTSERRRQTASSSSWRA